MVGFMAEANDKQTRFVKENSVNEGFLYDWYIHSVTDNAVPVWTEEHIRELCGDFYLVPKSVIDNKI
jgi:hypothetical protein